MNVLAPKLPREHPLFALTDRRALSVSVVCMALALSVAAVLGNDDEPAPQDVQRIFQSPPDLAP